MTPSPVSPRTRFAPMDALWIYVILAVLLVLGSVRLLPPNDLWWHARVGSEILDSGNIPRSDIYSLTERGQPFFYQSWLAEVLMAGILRLGGVRLLVIVRALIMTGLFGTVMLLCWWASERDRRVVIPVTLGAILLGLGNQTVRPQLFAYPLFITVYAILWRYRHGGARRSIWLVPILMVVWVNMHGSFALGLGLIWLVFLAELVGQMLPNLAGRRITAKMERGDRLKILGLVVLLGTAVLLVNPRGVGIVNYVADLLTDAPSQLLGAEWQPPNPTVGLGRTFYVLFLAGIVVFALARPAIALTELLLVLAFAWLAASGVRYVIWFALVSAPVVAGRLPRFPWDDLLHWRDRFGQNVVGQRLLYGDGTGYPGFRRLAVVVLMFALLGVAILLLFHPQDDLWLTPLTGKTAVEFMEREGLEGRLFNELGRGSYLIWRLGSAQPVFIDPRFELYSLQHFKEYLALSKAEPRAEELLAEHDFELLLLDRVSQAPLAELVADRPDRWRRVFADDYTLLYQRVER